MTEIEQLQQAIATLDAQRAILGDAVVNAALAPMREKLAALQAPAEEQRKQVTVLFADVSGFTALSERMDAEDVGALINAVWGRLDGILQARGGTIDKHIGDEVMALWGVRQMPNRPCARLSNCRSSCGRLARTASSPCRCALGSIPAPCYSAHWVPPASIRPSATP